MEAPLLMNRNRKKWMAAGGLALAGMLAFAWQRPAFTQTPAQQRMDDAHPAGARVDNRATAAELTATIAGSTDEIGGDVPRRNLIDEHIFGKMEADGIPHAPLANDTDFIRRVYLDLTARIPTPEEVREFVASTDPDKRDKLVDSLIGSKPYLARWTYWFGDLSRTNGNRIGNEGKNLYYRWTYDAFQINTPYNEMVEHMLTAKAVR